MSDISNNWNGEDTIVLPSSKVYGKLDDNVLGLDSDTIDVLRTYDNSSIQMIRENPDENYGMRKTDTTELKYIRYMIV